MFAPATVLGLLFVEGIPPKDPRFVERLLAAGYLGFVALLAFARFVTPSPGFRFDARRLWRTACVYCCIFVLWTLFVLFVYPWMFRQLGRQIPKQEHLQYFTLKHTWSRGYLLALVTVCVIGPIAEETFFRGFLGQALESL